jgi:hypothetical protein
MKEQNKIQCERTLLEVTVGINGDVSKKHIPQLLSHTF